MSGVSELKARIEAERGGQPFLLYTDAAGQERVFAFESGMTEASVGRQPSSDLVLDWDDQVSRLHARFERVGSDWAVVDDGLSRNGTFVNGDRLTGRHRLSDGDSLRFGATDVTFRARRVEPQRIAVEGETPAAEDLSSTQLRVLAGLCSRYKRGKQLTGAASDEQLGEDLFLSPGAVRTHLNVLFAKFGLDELAPDQRRFHLVERAISSGLISESDL
jgi:pSer/pThr/pTyr-binding forkhead associated (FHA) protein